MASKALVHFTKEVLAALVGSRARGDLGNTFASPWMPHLVLGYQLCVVFRCLYLFRD